jgi:hypothetical protein
MAETKTINLDIETNLGSLKSQLREAQAAVAELSAQFGATSQQAADAAKRAAELKDRIEDAKNLTDAFNPDAKFNALSRSIGGALDGFQAFEGAIGLVGVESEALQATLLKVQSAMALSQGIQGVMEAKDSFIQLGAVVKNAFAGMTTAAKVFMVSGIGLVIAALTTLVSQWDNIKNSLTPATAQAKRFEQSTRESGEAARKALENFDEYEKTLKRLGYTEDNIAAKRRKRYKEAIEQTKQELKAAEALYESQKENLETVGIFDSLGLNATGRALFGDEEEAKAQRKRVAKLRKDLAKIKNDEYEYRQQQKRDKEEKKKEEEEEKKRQKEEAAQKAKDAADKRKEELAQLRQYNREATDLFKTEYQIQKRDIEEKYAEQIALAKKYNQDTVDLEKAKNKELADLELRQVDLTREGLEKVETLQVKQIKQSEDFQKLVKDGRLQGLENLKGIVSWEDVVLDEQARRAVKREQAAQSMKVKLVQDGLSTIASITELFGKKSEKAAKRAFQVQKAANMASALISTYQNATAAYASQFTPLPTPDSPIRGGIAAGIAVATGLANVAKIAQQKFESPSIGGGGGSTGSTSGGVMSPNFNIVGNSGFNQLAQIQQQPIQAYVVSGEVTSAQALDRNRIKNATL